MELLLNIYAVCIIIILIYISFILNSKRKTSIGEVFMLMKEHKVLKEYLKEYEDIAWGMVFTEDLLITFLDNVTPPEDELNIAKHKYVDIIIGLMSTEIQNIFFTFFGDKAAFLQYLILRYDLRFKSEITNETASQIINEELSK